MTDEQEKAIKNLKKDMKLSYDAEGFWFEVYCDARDIETVLNMLKEKDRQIESKNRLLRIIGRKLNEAETELGKKNKIIDLIKAELEEKNKMIDLMAQDKYENVDMYQMADIGYEIGYDLARLFSGIPDEEVLNIIKQYFEGRAKGDEK